MKNPVTTITGIIMAVLAILTFTGVLTPEQQTGLETNLAAITEAVVAIVLIFKASDGQKEAGI